MDWIGARIADADGRPYGSLEEVFVGRTSGRPEFGIVGLDADSGGGRVAVPLTRAQQHEDGSLSLGVDPERVLDAPRVQRDVDEIPAGAGRLILDHFGMGGADELDDARQDDAHHDGEAETIAFDADEGPADVVRSEEQLVVGTRAEATERVRVRKRVVTEDVTLTVTLRREELVIEREAIAPGDVPAPTEFPLAEEGAEADFVLHAEEPVVTKRVVPVERVRLRRETTTEDVHVTETVRKELVDVDETPLTREDTLP